MVLGVIVHPAMKPVLPIVSEPISKKDGQSKNDCERNACARLLERFRKEHPHLEVIVIEDGLASNAPHINLLKKLKIDYILICKQGDHKSLFKFIEGSEKSNAVGHSHFEEGGIQHNFRSMNEVCLNESNPECLVNFIEYIVLNGKIA